MIVLDRPPYKIEIERAVIISLGGKKVVGKTITQISPKETADKLGISIKEAENLKIDLLERMKHDKSLFSSQCALGFTSPRRAKICHSDSIVGHS